MVPEAASTVKVPGPPCPDWQEVPSAVSEISELAGNDGEAVAPGVRVVV